MSTDKQTNEQYAAHQYEWKYMFNSLSFLNEKLVEVHSGTAVYSKHACDVGQSEVVSTHELFLISALVSVWTDSKSPVLNELYDVPCSPSGRLLCSCCFSTACGSCGRSIPHASSLLKTSCWLCMTACTFHSSAASWLTVRESDVAAHRYTQSTNKKLQTSLELFNAAMSLL